MFKAETRKKFQKGSAGGENLGKLGLKILKILGARFRERSSGSADSLCMEYLSGTLAINLEAKDNLIIDPRSDSKYEKQAL